LIEHADTFHLLAEIAIAVAGFAGVATVFGGRERSFTEAELLRLRMLFQLSALVLLGCFGLASIAAAGVPIEESVLIVSITLLLFWLCVSMDVPLKAIKLRRKNGSTVTPGSLAIGLALVVVGILLLAVNIFVLRQEWPLILLFSLFVLQSLWTFYRLLTKEN
jgi:hypothetical protein